MDGSACRRPIPAGIRVAFAAAGLLIPAVPAAPAPADRREILVVADASSPVGGEADRWRTEAQNLVDGLEDTRWKPDPAKAGGAPWVLLALNGPARGEPGESEVHALRIHATGGADRRTAAGIRVLGGLERNHLRELARAGLEASREAPGSPWRRIALAAARIRYLRIEIAGGSDREPIELDEIEAYGTGESMPRRPRRVSKDAAGNVSIEARPFFPLICARETTDLAGIVRAAFDTIVLPRGLTSDTKRLAWMDEAASAGLQVLAWIPALVSSSERAMARNMILAAADHPALLGYILDGTPEEDERRAALIHKLDPDHLTIRLAGAPDGGGAAPSPGAADAFAIEVDPRVPGRLAPYLAVIHGAKALAWRDPREDEEIRREIRTIETVLFAPDPPADSPLWRASAIDNPSERIDASLKAAGAEVWLIAANPEARPARPRFAFGWADAIQIREVFAREPLERRVDEGSPVEIPFAARGVRVLRMRPSGPIGPRHPPALPDGRPLARANPSVLEVTRERVRSLRDDGNAIEAANLIDAFRARYGDRVPADLLETLEREQIEEKREGESS
ncbi:MAG: hypothetical protein JXP34_11335 [Planctomycetes bacterium]|nr:hypothetical protein [Planctomycetota bacterium]